MSKQLSDDEKLQSMRIMCKSFSKEQVEHLDRIEVVAARYKCAQRYMREINEGKKGERIKALEYYKKYADILEGLDCVDNKLWTDEKKIKAFCNKLDTYCDKCVQLIEENNRKHLDSLKAQRARLDSEIAALEKQLG